MSVSSARSANSNRALWLRGVAIAAVAITLPACATMPAESVNIAAPAAINDLASERDAMKLAARPSPQYPPTVEENLVEEQFGIKVADPYRWLENDVRNSEGVAMWVKSQQDVTNAYLKDIPGKAQLKASMAKMFDYERFGVPRRAGNRYFYMRNDGLQNQSVLYVRDGLTGEGRPLIDPNAWAKDGATALAEWSPSKDGTMLAYSIQDGGSDWRTVRVMDVATGKDKSDSIEWVKFSGIEWIGNEGIIYSRFPAPDSDQAFQALNTNQAVYFHKIGTPQNADTLLYATPDRPVLNHVGEVTSDGQWLVLTSSSGTDDRFEIHGRKIEGGKAMTAPLVPIVSGFDHNWTLVDGVGDRLWFMTNKDAPRLKITTTQIGTGQKLLWRDIVAERPETLDGASIVGDKIILAYLKDAQAEVEMVTLDGAPAGKVDLGGIGTAAGFGGDAGNSETFYSFSGFTSPSVIYRMDTSSGERSVFAKPDLPFNPDDYVTEQRFYASKDGTKIPMFLVYRKDLDLTKGHPTMLYGYGGFNISLTPSYSATRMAWLQAGGVYAQAGLRGGGEYGKAWHDGGRLLNKQNVFDDFIAAGEYLIGQGITGKGQLAIEGRSNGGLLVGAVVNQRPDLFGAAHAAVGVMDMLRFDRFTAGRYWVDDYGYPNKEADFRNLLTYSPYHTVKDGVQYPAVLVSTADTDDRVVPGHSFKYTARLQAADAGPKPHLIRIETRAGHGSGKPTDKTIEEYSDIYAFLGYWTGLFNDE
jgi:prolyl oligopeptidase